MRYHDARLEWLQGGTLTLRNAGKDAERRELHSLLVGMKKYTATVEDGLAVSYKKNILTI